MICIISQFPLKILQLYIIKKFKFALFHSRMIKKKVLEKLRDLSKVVQFVTGKRAF